MKTAVEASRDTDRDHGEDPCVYILDDDEVRLAPPDTDSFFDHVFHLASGGHYEKLAPSSIILAHKVIRVVQNRGVA